VSKGRDRGEGEQEIVFEAHDAPADRDCLRDDRRRVRGSGPGSSLARHVVSVQTVDTSRSERIREILDDLIRQRQTLRVGGMGGDPILLEANRRSIVYWQAELAQALVAENGRPQAAA